MNRELSAFLKSAGKQSHKEKVSDLVRGILDVANRLPKQEPYGKLFGYASAVIELERALSLANDANGTIEAALLDARRENAELRQQVTNQLAFCSPSAELSKIIDDSCLCKDPHCDECQQMLYAIGAIEVRMKAAESVSHEPKKGRNEVAWLIEMSFDGKAHWWYGSDFIDDAGQAVRFARRDDAVQVIMERGLVDATPTEHMWCSSETGGAP